jgi:hypothetical protein
MNAKNLDSVISPPARVRGDLILFAAISLSPPVDAHDPRPIHGLSAPTLSASGLERLALSFRSFVFLFLNQPNRPNLAFRHV